MSPDETIEALLRKARHEPAPAAVVDAYYARTRAQDR